MFLGWLDPLLDRVARDPSCVISPVIDAIKPDTLRIYFPQGGSVLVGGFDWNLQVSHQLRG